MIKIVMLVAFVFIGGSALSLEESTSSVNDDILGFAPGFFDLARNGMKHPRYRWPQNTLVYEFEYNYPLSMKKLFKRAIHYISKKTCLRFAERTNQVDYVHVGAERGCSSFVGRIGGRQEMSLSEGCQRFGTVVHEIMHALGYGHEHSRPDRDDYVKILWENIIPGTEHNFVKMSADHVWDFNVTYDYGSLLHYPRDAFSKNGKPTILPGDPKVEIGQRKRMSEGDVKKLVNMYWLEK